MLLCVTLLFPLSCPSLVSIVSLTCSTHPVLQASGLSLFLILYHLPVWSLSFFNKCLLNNYSIPDGNAGSRELSVKKATEKNSCSCGVLTDSTITKAASSPVFQTQITSSFLGNSDSERWGNMSKVPHSGLNLKYILFLNILKLFPQVKPHFFIPFIPRSIAT